MKTLKSKGFTAYFAGGCVRDILLGIKPKDIDIVTDALPDQIEAVFEHTVPIGKKFGVIKTIVGKHHFEIASFRSDSGYSDGRRPDAVIFSNPENDAKRRDFTINGMFFDPVEDEIIDFTGGQSDLNAKLIRFIGDPEQRILEDHLRILRAIRFRNQFDFQYHPETYKAILKNKQLILEGVSVERIRDEIIKMIMDKTNPSMSFEDMSHLGVLRLIIPELEDMRGCAQPSKYHLEGDVWTHTMMALDSLSEDSSLIARLATLFHDIGKPQTFALKERIRFDSHAEVSAQITERVLTNLRFSSKIIKSVSWCITHHMMMIPFVEMSPPRRAHWFLNKDFPALLDLMKADAKGTIPSDLSLYNRIYRLYINLKRRIKAIPRPLLNGNEIMEIRSIPASSKLTEIKNKLVEMQLAKKIRNKKQAKKWVSKLKISSGN